MTRINGFEERCLKQSECLSVLVEAGEQQWQSENVTYKVVDDICESPHHRHAEEGYAQEHNVKYSNTERVGQPDPPTVHDPSVWVHLTVCHTHVHSGLWTQNKCIYIYYTTYTSVKHVSFAFLPHKLSFIINILSDTMESLAYQSEASPTDIVFFWGWCH